MIKIDELTEVTLKIINETDEPLETKELEEIDRAADVLEKVVARLREMSPLYHK